MTLFDTSEQHKFKINRNRIAINFYLPIIKASEVISAYYLSTFIKNILSLYAIKRAKRVILIWHEKWFALIVS